jgi:hypothetical protein
MAKKKKRPTDINQRAKSILDIATGETKDNLKEEDLVKLAASAMGRKGGLKGGKARAKSLTAQKRSDIAKKAALVRWKKK